MVVASAKKCRTKRAPPFPPFHAAIRLKSARALNFSLRFAFLSANFFFSASIVRLQRKIAFFIDWGSESASVQNVELCSVGAKNATVRRNRNRPSLN